MDTIVEPLPLHTTTANVVVEFRQITYSVTKKGRSTQLLNGVTGQCLPGRLLSIMGPSGAGKTTLLNVLANMRGDGVLGGEVLVNGVPRTRAAFRRISGYVQQHDVLLATATVSEAIATSAFLSLPRSMPKQEKLNRVAEILKELDLEGCATVRVGDVNLGIKGASGGQRRRVSVGIELVKSPSVMFLDEPTSGLDSETASKLMATLLQMAKKDRTMVCTIHQPNSHISSMFDDLLLLSRGVAVFSGPCSEALSFFSSQGFNCPHYTNPTDYYMMVVTDEHSARLLAEALSTKSAVDDNGNTMHSNSFSQLQCQTSSLAEIAAARPMTSFGYQLWRLSQRFCKHWVRNPHMLVSEVVQYIAIALIIGILYFNVTDQVRPGAYDRTSAIWFYLTIFSTVPSFINAHGWSTERILVLKELRSLQYKPSAYFWARSLTMMPFEILMGFVYTVIVYFMVGFQANAANFFVFYGVSIMFTFTADAIGLLCGIVGRTELESVILLTLIEIMVITCSGFTSSVRPYLIWVQKTSFLTYAQAALIQNEFTSLYLVTETGKSVPAVDFIPSSLSTGLTMAVNIAVLAGAMVGCRLLAWVALIITTAYRRS